MSYTCGFLTPLPSPPTPTKLVSSPPCALGHALQVARNKFLNKYNSSLIDRQFEAYKADGLTPFEPSTPTTLLPSSTPRGASAPCLTPFLMGDSACQLLACSLSHCESLSRLCDPRAQTACAAAILFPLSFPFLGTLQMCLRARSSFVPTPLSPTSSPACGLTRWTGSRRETSWHSPTLTSSWHTSPVQ